MVSIVIANNGSGITVRAAGHAEYAPHGQDIVCAGVSAVLYGCLSCLLDAAYSRRENSDNPPHVYISDRPELLAFATDGFDDGFDLEAVRIIAFSLRMLAEEYPRHVAVKTINLK